MSDWEAIFEQSRIISGTDNLQDSFSVWSWPAGTWFQCRLEEVRRGDMDENK